MKPSFAVLFAFFRCFYFWDSA